MSWLLRLLLHWFSGRTASGTPRRQAPRRLCLEGLEDRTLLAMLLVDPLHYHSLQAALTAAAAGDTIQISANANVHAYNHFQGTVTPGTAATTTQITVTPTPTFSGPPSFTFTNGVLVNAEFVTFTQGPNAARVLVDAIAPSGNNLTLTLHTPLPFTPTGERPSPATTRR